MATPRKPERERARVQGCARRRQGAEEEAEAAAVVSAVGEEATENGGDGGGAEEKEGRKGAVEEVTHLPARRAGSAAGWDSWSSRYRRRARARRRAARCASRSAERAPTHTAPCSGRPTSPRFPRATPPRGQRSDRLPRGGAWTVWPTWEPSSWGAAVSQAAEAGAKQCRLLQGRSHRRRPARGRGSLACFLSAPRPGPSGPPGGSARRATGSPAPPQGRSLPGGLSLLATALPRNAHGHGSQWPFIVVLPPPPIRPGAGEKAGSESRSDGSPGAQRVPAPRSKVRAELGIILALSRAPSPLGTGPSHLRCAGASSLRSRRAAHPLLHAPLPAPTGAARYPDGNHGPGGETKGRDRLDGRAITVAALGPGGAWTPRSGGPVEGGPG
ncbi:uncharacterized protein [Patagioenas fasciata]|uniref:uncharacterized protein n=1 Tax=Patagioenas fasciata TaxID=372321 RepID=UPI003A992DE9